MELQKLIEQQQIIGAKIRRLATLQRRFGLQRINVRIASTTRQWMALDKQIKRLCVIEVDSQQMRAGIENQLAEIK